MDKNTEMITIKNRLQKSCDMRKRILMEKRVKGSIQSLMVPQQVLIF